MAKTSGKKGYLAAFIGVAVLVAAYFIYKNKKNNFLDHQLQDLVQDKSNQLYKLSYDSISVDEAGGDVYIKNLHLKGDTSVQLQMLNGSDTNALKLLMDIYVPVLKVEDFKTASALLSKQLVCRHVLISNPQVTLYLFPGQKKQQDQKKQREELYKQILGNLKLIKADSISVINSEIVVKDFYSKENKFHTYNTSVALSDVAIDSAYSYDTARTLFCKEISLASAKVIAGDKNNTAEISNVSFDTRSQVVAISTFEYDAFKNKGFFKSKLEGISLKGLNWSGPVENSDLSIAEAVFEKGELETLSVKGSNKKREPAKPQRILTGWFQSFSLTSLRLKTLTYISRPADRKSRAFVLKNNSIYIKDVFINRSDLLDGSLINKAKEIDISNNEIAWISEDEFYKFRFSGVVLNTLSKKISAKSVEVMPQLNETAFAKKAIFQKDRYDIHFRNLECGKVDMEKLVQGEIAIDNISTSNNSILVFHDLSYKIDSASREQNSASFPHQLLHKADFPIRAGRFTASKTYIEYKEKNLKSQSSGRVRFANSLLTIQGISNHPSKQGEKTDVRFSASFLGKIPVTANIIFYNDEWKKGKFSVEAAISKGFDATLLSELTRPMSLAVIDRGVINSLKFNMTADTALSKGSIILTYDNLKLSLLKKKGSEYNKKDIFSLLANLLVKNKNENKPGMRTAAIEVKRDRYKSFFNFIWKSIFAGAKQILVFKI